MNEEMEERKKGWGKMGVRFLEERRGEERRELRLPDQLYTDDLLLCGE